MLLLLFKIFFCFQFVCFCFYYNFFLLWFRRLFQSFASVFLCVLILRFCFCIYFICSLNFSASAFWAFLSALSFSHLFLFWISLYFQALHFCFCTFCTYSKFPSILNFSIPLQHILHLFWISYYLQLSYFHFCFYTYFSLLPAVCFFFYRLFRIQFCIYAGLLLVFKIPLIPWFQVCSVPVLRFYPDYWFCPNLQVPASLFLKFFQVTVSTLISNFTIFSMFPGFRFRRFNSNLSLPQIFQLHFYFESFSVFSLSAGLPCSIKTDASQFCI